MEVESHHGTTLAINKMSVGLDVVLKLLGTVLLLATTAILVPTFVKVQDHDVRISNQETLGRKRDQELVEIKGRLDRLLDRLDAIVLRLPK
jgi:hypothetical protein